MAAYSKRVSVTTASTPITQLAGDQATHLIRNTDGAVAIEIGGSDVVFGSGFPLAAGAQIEWSTFPGETLYAVSSTGTVTVAVLTAGGTRAAEKASLTTALTGTNNDLVFTAVSNGAAGNDITVEYVDPAANSQSLDVTVVGTDITVSLATDGGGAITSTGSLILAAVNGDTEANDLVVVSLAAGNNGSGVVTAMAQTNLSGGRDREN